tara:strand:- start:1146 stop:1349 length:204 start_codon:yes stop_codon:yes gene_type:complete
MFNKELKERVRLLEFENKILLDKIDSIINKYSDEAEVLIDTCNYMDRSMSYEYLRDKYRSCSKTYDM